MVHLDNGDHVTGREAHLVSSHQELEGVLVNPHLPMFSPSINGSNRYKTIKAILTGELYFCTMLGLVVLLKM